MFLKNKKVFLFLCAVFSTPSISLAATVQITCDQNTPCPNGVTPQSCGGGHTSGYCGGKEFFVCVKNKSDCNYIGSTGWPDWNRLASQRPVAAPNQNLGSGGFNPRESSYSDLQARARGNSPSGPGQITPDQYEKAMSLLQTRNPDGSKIQQDQLEMRQAQETVKRYEAQEQYNQRLAQEELTRRDNEARDIQNQSDRNLQDRVNEAKKDDTRFNGADAVNAMDGDECSHSDKLLAGEAGCKGTRTMVNWSQGLNVTSQIAGSVSTQIVGAGAAQRAANSQTQSGALRAAASTQDTTAKMQMGVGAMNAIMGAIQMGYSMNHSDKAKKITSGTSNAKSKIETSRLTDQNEQTDGYTKGDHGYFAAKEGNEIVKNAMDAGAYDFNRTVQSGDLKKVSVSQQAADAATANGITDPARIRQIEKDIRESQVRKKEGEIVKGIQTAGRRGMEEQKRVADESLKSSIFSFATGAQQLIVGFFNKKGADETKKAADQLEQAEQRAAMQAAAAFVPPRADTLASSDALGARAPTAITGSGQNSAATDIQAQNQNPIDTTGTDGFGESRSPENLNNTPNGAPPPGVFDTSKGGGGVAQGGGGFSAGGNTMANDQAGKEGPGATAYNDTAGKMESGGGGRGAAYGGGGGRGGGENPSINPADMLAQLGKLMPGQEEQQKKNTSIESYINRAPAGAGAWVPQGESIFEHVSMAYRAQQRRKAVGI